MSRSSTPLPLHHVSSSHLRAPSPLVSSGRPASPSSSITSTFSLLSPSESAQRHQTSLAAGISQTDANARLLHHGPNELPHEEPEPLWLRFLKQFKETLILLLLASAGISFFMGNLDDAVSITIAVTIVVTVGFVQEYRSEKSLEALNKLVPHFAHLIRAGDGHGGAAERPPRRADGEGSSDDGFVDATKSQMSALEKASSTVPASQLVPGDLVLFTTGDRIPADVRITRAADLTLDESNLTGENEPVRKNTEALERPSSSSLESTSRPMTPLPYSSPAAGTVGADIRLNDQTNIAFMGTLVRSGHGQGIVIATGANTEFGAISASLSEIESPRTPLQLSMDRLGQELSYMSFGVIFLIMLVGLWQGRKLLEMFTIGVSLAVAAIPEGLPIIVTVTLALGVLRMARQGAIVRRLPSVETLGSVNVVCSDKTGTLTMNHMTVTKIWHFDAEEAIEVTKDTLSSPPDSVTRNILRIGNIANNARLSKAHGSSPATAAVFSSTLDPSNPSGRSRWVGQPTDVAMVDLLDAYGEDDIRDRLAPRSSETPFSSERKWMGVIISSGTGSDSGHSGAIGSEMVYIKGALEQILTRCDTYLTRDGREVVLDEPRRKQALAAAERMAEDGLRVLGFASGSGRGPSTSNLSAPVKSRSATPKPEPEKSPLVRSNTDKDEESYRGLMFAGIVGMNDPPRKGVEKSIRRLMSGGVKIIMITGDAETTAVAIAKKLGMPINSSNPNLASRAVLRGDELDRMSESELAQAISSTSIFARTSPEHKMKIIRALQSRGDVVAMTGDGVNDAPALKKADIGISMGMLGTDVAKEAADMILTDDDFSTILSAIEEGKGIFYNIQNFLTFQLSTSVAALSLVLLSSIFGFKNPLNAMQILWINILMDGPPAQSLGVEPVDPAVMTRPPRSRTARVLTKPLITRVLTSATIITFCTLLIYIREMAADGAVTARDTTMTFTSFVLFDMFNALNCRSASKSVLRGEIPLFGNKMFNYAVSGSLAGQLAVIYLSPLQRIFQTEAIGFGDLVGLICVASLVFWADEGRKFWESRRGRRGRWGSGYSANV
ncbi:MAG: dolichyl-diphosphooligosaccharide--protein glycosyltransferase subunit 1 [Chaenotheca gracillima]|nr:MAG: dolichyl-diphosphooligosaccharide--protein glycosyltransferase subunit 1 [Chaenotheca gracillima]